MKVLFYLFVIIGVIVKIDAREMSGQCRASIEPVVKPFYLDRYMGCWWEIKWYDSVEKTYDECLEVIYTQTSPTTFDTTMHLQVSNQNYAVQTYPDHGKQVKDGALIIGSATLPNYNVLSTDYTNYAFVWSCVNVNQTHYDERIWYFDRQPNPIRQPDEVTRLIHSYFNEEFVRTTYHGKKCTYPRVNCGC